MRYYNVDLSIAESVEEQLMMNKLSNMNNNMISRWYGSGVSESSAEQPACDQREPEPSIYHYAVPGQWESSTHHH